MRNWCNYDWLILDGIWWNVPGYYEIFISPTFGDPSKFDFDRLPPLISDEMKEKMKNMMSTMNFDSDDYGEDD